MINNIQKQRRYQPYEGAFGKIVHSPKKRRNYKQVKELVQPLGFHRRQQQLQQRLLDAQAKGQRAPVVAPSKGDQDSDSEDWESDNEPEPSTSQAPMDMEWEADPAPGLPDPFEHNPEVQTPQPSPAKSRSSARSSPTKAARISHHKRWIELLPTLIPQYLQYCEATLGKPVPLPEKLESTCNQNCVQKTYQILSLFHDHAATNSVSFCSCEGVVQVLVKNGLFPGSPSQPNIAVSIALLDLYQTLFEQSCDAVNALASALVTHYRRRGFPVLNSSGGERADGLRKTVTAAVSWYDHLGRLVEEQAAKAIEDAAQHMEKPSIPPREPPAEESKAHQYLRQKCPACYAGMFGASIADGCDVHVFLDGCFNHRRLKHAGDPPHAHVPEHYVSKEDVDAMGSHILEVRKKPAKKRSKVVVPDEAVDECEDGHIARTGTNVKTDSSRYDDTGTMALVCRHDTPILLANINTPGEQQKYAAALLKKLFSMLPKSATVAVFYDIGCVFDRSLQLYDILPASITTRMTIATSIMHSYAHQWSCQLVYNPRIREGLGLLDGEGVERYWSRMRKIISVTRTSGRQRRLWLIDRLTARIAAESRDNLGSWMIRRHKDLDERIAKQTKILNDCQIPEYELRELWAEQRKTQLSIRAHAPTRLKKDLDKLITIQGDLDKVENTIKEATSTLGKGSQVASTLKDLTSVYEQLSSKLDSLYLSLNITESFPALRDLPFAAVHKLLIARDLKINIRKRAIASFFENEKLEQAVGGRNETLGTKNHQQVRAAIKKQKPAFVSAIRRFNKICAELKVLLKPEWNIPVPEPLPTDIHELRDESHLMEDVWIERTVGKTPRWIECPEVRVGIRAMLVLDRCKEERLRLGKEADNMCRWFGDELTRTHIAISDPTNLAIRRFLESYRTRLLLFEPKWSGSPAVSKIRYQHHIENAKKTATMVSSTLSWQSEAVWLPVVEHHGQVIDFDSSMFADDEGVTPTPNPFLSDLTTDADAANLPDPDALMLQDLMEDGEEEPGDEELLEGPPFNVVWTAPTPLVADNSLVESLEGPWLSESSRHHGFRRLRLPSHLGEGAIEFCSQSLDRLAHSSERLNDVCINTGALLLLHIFSHERFKHQHAARCAVFSSFVIDVSRHRLSLSETWRRTKPTQYWHKPVWLIPIHREYPAKHWVLCIVYPQHRRVYLYDSFAASMDTWKDDIKDIKLLLTMMAEAAHENNKSFNIHPTDEWTVQPLLTTAVQTTSFSCGLWVLAVVSAVLRGHHNTAISERSLPKFRTLLYQWALTLPAI